jgi:hypothetical protein
MMSDKREDKPRNINPDDVDFTHSAKKTSAQDKIDIKESEIGRETSQMPATENLDMETTQIDEETLGLHNDNPVNKDVTSKDILDESTPAPGYRSEINSSDQRDTGDSITDWDAENNQSGRRK